jgi:WD repeat-containing protein 34
MTSSQRLHLLPASFSDADEAHIQHTVYSTWKVEKQSNCVEFGTQANTKQFDNSSQTRELISVEIQTDTAVPDMKRASMELEHKTTSARWEQFFANVVPAMEQALSEIDETTLQASFESFQTQALLDEHDSVQQVAAVQEPIYQATQQQYQNQMHRNVNNASMSTHSHSLDIKQPMHESEFDGGCHGCTDMCWNANGTVIAAAHGELNHVGWCSHAASVRVWNVSGGSSMKTRPPDVQYGVTSCVMSLAFHPKNPSILAAGLFNGEVRVWDMTNDEEPLIAASTVDDFMHREPVCSVTWTHNTNTHEIELVTAGNDGKILFWKLHSQLRYPQQGYVVAPIRMYQGQGTRPNRHSVIGAASCAVSSIDPSNIVIGTEAGGVLKGVARTQSSSKRFQQNNVVTDGEFKWTIDAQKIVQNSVAASRFHVKRAIEKYARVNQVGVIDLEHVFAARPDWKQLYPVASNFAYDAHQGPTYAVKFSPSQRNLFLTGSTDGTIRLYHTLSRAPVLHIECGGAGTITAVAQSVPSAGIDAATRESRAVMAIDWSPARPSVFAVADSHGQMHVYDLTKSPRDPVVSVDASSSAAPIRSIQFSPIDGGLVATADASGAVSVWKLSARLSEIQPLDASTMRTHSAVEHVS